VKQFEASGSRIVDRSVEIIKRVLYNSLRTGSQRGQKKNLAIESVILRAKRVGRRGACRDCF